MLLLIRSLPLSFALSFVPRIMEMAFQKLFLGENAPRPPRLRVLMAPCSYSQLFFSNQLPTLKPLMHYLHVLVTSSALVGVPNCVTQDFRNAMVR